MSKTTQSKFILDKNNKPIIIGDLLKWFHFTGARWRKKYYMYKQVLGYKSFTNESLNGKYFEVGHLELNSKKSSFILLIDNQKLDHVEILQGVGGNDIDRREKITKGISGNEDTLILEEVKK